MTDSLQQSPQITSSHRAYADLADYAAQQGVPESAFVDAGYHIVSHYDSNSQTKRPAFCFPTAGGRRYRWIDGLPGNKYTSQFGYKRCWYGLERAVTLAQETGQPLVLVNGEAGTVAAQYHGLPACCVTSGEKRSMPENLLAELQATYSGVVLIALDNDGTGRKAGAALAEQLQTAGLDARAVDLSLPNDGGDIADFCKLHGEHAAELLADLPTIEVAPVVRQRRETAPRMPVADDDQRAARYAETTIANVLAELAATRTDRNNTGFRIGCTVLGFALGNWPGVDRVRVLNRFEEALQATGLPGSEIKNLIKSVEKRAESRPLELPDNDPPRHRQTINTRHLDSPRQDATIVQYVSDDLTPDKLAQVETNLIQAPVGMGKTHAIAAYVNGLPDGTKVTGIAQFRLLTNALAAALKAAHYEDATPETQRGLAHLDRLVTSVSSMYKFNRESDVLIIDEIEGVLQFLAGSDTFTGNGAVVAYATLKADVHSARQLIGMDAGLSAITENWIAQRRGKPIVKRYRRADKRGTVQFLGSKQAAYWIIGNLLRAGKGTVYVPCSSEKTASEAATLFSGGAYRVMKITSDTSSTAPVKAFSESAANRAGYDLVIYTAAMGAGVDISEPVFATVGIFDRVPLAPEAAIQLFGRVRNAKHYFAAVPGHTEGYDTPTADELVSRRLAAEISTAGRLHMTPAANGDYLELLQLWAQFEARRLKETAQWRRYFAARLKANGYSAATNTAKAPQAFRQALKEWQGERAESDWHFVLQGAVGRALDKPTLERFRLAGHEITHEMRLLNTRQKIETALTHEDVTELDFDLMKRRARIGLYRLADMLKDESALLDADRAQALEGRPIQKKSNRAETRRLLAELLALMGFKESTPAAQVIALAEYASTEHTATELKARFAALESDEALELFKALGHYGNNARTIPGLYRWVLGLFGLELDSRRIGRAESREMVYKLNEHTAYRLARSRRAAGLKACTTNVYSTTQYTKVVHSHTATPTGEGWRKIPFGTGLCPDPADDSVCWG